MEIVGFAFEGTISASVLKKLKLKKKFFIASDNKKIEEFVQELIKLKPKYILGMGMYSHLDRSRLRIETRCTDKNKSIDINYFLEPNEYSKLAEGIGNSYCNHVSVQIMKAIFKKRLDSQYTFIHIPKTFDVNKAVSEIKEMIDTKVFKEEVPPNFPKTFEEFYKMFTKTLVNGNKEQQTKLWKMMQSNEGIWTWVRAKLVTETYSFADAKGKEEFCLIGMQKHLKSGNATLFDEIFIDEETGIKYRQYKFKNAPLYRIPFATDGMDKITYDNALNKKFAGDYIETHSVDGVEYTLLDTKEKADDYNIGNYYKKWVIGKRTPKDKE